MTEATWPDWQLIETAPQGIGMALVGCWVIPDPEDSHQFEPYWAFWHADMDDSELGNEGYYGNPPTHYAIVVGPPTPSKEGGEV